MTEREYRGKTFKARKRLVANNYRAIEDFILRGDVFVEHWSLQNYGEDIAFDERSKDELLAKLEEGFPFLQFTMADDVVRWTLGGAR